MTAKQLAKKILAAKIHGQVRAIFYTEDMREFRVIGAELNLLAQACLGKEAKQKKPVVAKKEAPVVGKCQACGHGIHGPVCSAAPRCYCDNDNTFVN